MPLYSYILIHTVTIFSLSLHRLLLCSLLCCCKVLARLLLILIRKFMPYFMCIICTALWIRSEWIVMIIADHRMWKQRFYFHAVLFFSLNQTAKKWQRNIYCSFIKRTELAPCRYCQNYVYLLQRACSSYPERCSDKNTRTRFIWNREEQELSLLFIYFMRTTVHRWLFFFFYQ